MKQIICTGILTLLMAFSLQATMLNTRITVQDEYIRLGDIFEGLDDQGDIPVAKSPSPGKTTSLKNHWLRMIAKKYRIAWKPQSPFEYSKVSRESEVVTTEEIKELVNQKLQETLNSNHYDLKFDQSNLEVHFPVGSDHQLTLKNLALNPDRTRFTAHFDQIVDRKKVAPLKVTGLVIPITRIPVLARPIAGNDIISARDIEWIDVPQHQVTATTITDAETLIGSAPKRSTLRDHVPLSSNDVKMPLMIKRGEMVILVAETPYMNLTTKGKALENGAIDQVVRIMNMGSNRVVQATVTGHKRAEVGVAHAAAQNIGIS